MFKVLYALYRALKYFHLYFFKTLQEIFFGSQKFLRIFYTFCPWIIYIKYAWSDITLIVQLRKKKYCYIRWDSIFSTHHGRSNIKNFKIMLLYFRGCFKNFKLHIFVFNNPDFNEIYIIKRLVFNSSPAIYSCEGHKRQYIAYRMVHYQLSIFGRFFQHNL